MSQTDIIRCEGRGGDTGAEAGLSWDYSPWTEKKSWYLV